jgi:PAS domain S-box-containing protein
LNRDQDFVVREILEQTMAGYWDWNIPTGNEYLSPMFKKMFGYEDHELENRVESWQKLIFQEDLPVVMEKFTLHVKSKGDIPFYNEVRYQHKNGSTIWVICKGKVIEWDAQGNPLRMIGCHIDITELKKAGETIKTERAQLFSIFDSIKEPIYVADMDTYEVLFANLALKNVTGKDTVGGICYREFQGLDAPCPFCTNSIIKKMQPEPYCWQHYNPLLKHYYSLHDRVIQWPDGRDVRLELAVDITELKETEYALFAEKERLTVTLGSIADGVITTDMQGRVLIFNKVAEKLTGWTAEEAIGKPLGTVFKIVNEINRQPCADPVKKVLSSGEPAELANNTLLISKDGKERIIADSAAPIKNSENKNIGVVLVFRDVTMKYKFLENIQRTSRLESLGVLAGGIAHDFNNLLGGIFGYIDMALDESRQETVSNYLSESLKSIERARGLTKQLLTFAKGGVPVKKKESLVPLLQDTVRFALSGSAIICKYSIQENLWPCDFNKSQIAQVIDNMVINAKQAMPSGGDIEIAAKNITIKKREHMILPTGDYVKISIKDSGVGIPHELFHHIFDPFYTTKSKGHGLGLAICHSIVARHGGFIDIESELNSGSTFHIFLPASLNSTKIPGEKPKSKHLGSGKFIVMDDEDAILGVVGKMLESFGYEIELMKNGNEVIAYFSKEIKAKRKISGMILDLTVPGGLGGKAVIAEIRKLCPHTPVFVASGYADDPVMAHPAEYGFTASICKPFMMKELAEMLNHYIHKQ